MTGRLVQQLSPGPQSVRPGPPGAQLGAGAPLPPLPLPPAPPLPPVPPLPVAPPAPPVPMAPPVAAPPPPPLPPRPPAPVVPAVPIVPAVPVVPAAPVSPAVPLPPVPAPVLPPVPGTTSVLPAQPPRRTPPATSRAVHSAREANRRAGATCDPCPPSADPVGGNFPTLTR